jgi:hypothetical protein
VIALQELIETLHAHGGTADDATKQLRARHFVMGGNVMLAWQAERVRGAAVLELDGDETRDDGVTLRGPTDGATWVACSNHHRARSEKGHRCGRYRSLARGSSKAEALDVPGAWALLGEASASITLYRCVADLGAGRLGVERHTEEGWQPRVELSAHAATVR